MRSTGPTAILLAAWVTAAIITPTPTNARPKPAPPPPPAVGIVRAEQMPIVETTDFVGRIEAINKVALVARVTAFLEKRLFTEGAEVKQGDLLYQLEQGPFQADVDAKQAALEQTAALLQDASITRSRAQALLPTVAGQRSAYDTALANERSGRAQVSAAVANLENSKINLGYTEIHAPIDGKISATAVTEGNVVSPTTGTLANIVSQDPMYVVFPMSSRSALELRARYAGNGGFNAVRVRVKLPTGETYAQNGKMDYISPTVSATTDTLIARAVIPNPQQTTEGGARVLIDGEFVQVLVEGLQPIKVLGVPRAAVLSDQQGDYVFTIGPDDKVLETRVQLGQSTPSTAAVTSGLKEGQMVIVEGIQRVRPGEKVIPGPATPMPTAH